jgi:hypothetical protein
VINILTLALFFSFSGMLNAQISTPAPSSSCKMEQTVGLTDITINYSRPSMKGRTIFAEDGLVPFDKLWRLGANAATKVSFSDDVKIEGNDLKAGDYAVLATPGADSWDFHFHTYESGSYGSYVEKTPALTVTVKPVSLPITMETMLITIGQITTNSAVMQLVWEKTLVPVNIEVEVESVVMAQIEKVMAGPSTNDYYAAASYYHDNGKDLEQALEWMQKATAGDSPRFWHVRKEALILGDLGRYDDAVMAAKKSLELAKEAGNDEYVKMNEDSIKAWSMKK